MRNPSIRHGFVAIGLFAFGYHMCWSQTPALLATISLICTSTTTRIIKHASKRPIGPRQQMTSPLSVGVGIRDQISLSRSSNILSSFYHYNLELSDMKTQRRSSSSSHPSATSRPSSTLRCEAHQARSPHLGYASNEGPNSRISVASFSDTL